MAWLNGYNILRCIEESLIKRKEKGRLMSERYEVEHASPLSYVDLLILTLTQHEKSLNMIIEKLDRISNKLDRISRQLAEERGESGKPET
jgi:hypothetical protein